MIVALIGSREYVHFDIIREVVAQLTAGTEVISGGARGVDRFATHHARERGLVARDYPADWKTLGKFAGIKRNTALAEMADTVIAFWDGSSTGTANMMQQSLAAGKLSMVYVQREAWTVSRA